MDGPKIDENYREKFEKLATCKGEIVALYSNTLGERFALGEKYLLEAYNTAAAHNALMPPDMKAMSGHKMAVSQEGRAAIQEAKNRYGIPLDTPPVSDTPAPRSDVAINDPHYGADVTPIR